MAAAEDPAGVELPDRDRRALEGRMSVLPDTGRAAGAPDLYLVVSDSGAEYLVDARDRRCECPDSEYREPAGGCKHVRRVAFATGDRAIPTRPGVDVDPHLGEHLTGVDEEGEP